MTRSDLAGVLALVSGLALATPARAQQTGGLRPTGDQPAPAGAADPAAPPQVPAPADTPAVEAAPKDPGGWRGQQPAAPAPQASAPAAGVPEAQPGQDPLAAPQPDPAEQARNNRIIDNNYKAALKTYDGVLNNEGEPIEGLDHRIKTNENLVADYKRRLAASNEVKRRLQVELFNRTFYLKQQRDKGAIPEDVFQKLMKQEDKKYQDKSASTRSDIEFYEKEIAEAEKRLTELRAERRVQTVSTQTNKAAAGKSKKPPMKRSDVLIGSLKDRLQKLNGYETKHTMDNPQVCDQCMAPHAPGGPVESAPAGDPPPPADR